MNLYLLSQSDNRGYDTYDSCVVAAETEEEARLITPSQYENFGGCFSAWASSPETVVVECIGKAKRGTSTGVILSSFNAG